jgi:uncharacterized SAM-binding protein YcdF (DUF218 family)
MTRLGDGNRTAVAFTAPDPASARRSRRLWVATILLGVALVAWQSRDRVLTAVGTALTAEDPLAPVEVIVTSIAAGRADALESARLYHQGIGRRIVLARWQEEPLDDELRRLGVPWLPISELVVAMLEKSGVPAEAIRMLDGPIDGLNTEITTVAEFAHQEKPASLLFVTARSHSRRARWLLQRLLPADTRLLVRAPAGDAFRPDAWWHSRGGSREVAMEYLRWANTFGLRDFWQDTPPSVPETAE